MSILRTTYFLVALVAALSVVGCRHGPAEMVQPEPTPETEPTAEPTPQLEPTPETEPTAEPTPQRAGTILLYRDGDLYLLEGQSERPITQSGDYVTGMLTRDGLVIALREGEEDSSSLILMEVEGGGVSTTAEIPLDRPLPEWITRTGFFLPSPDEGHVLVPGTESYLMVSLDEQRVVREMPTGCCDSWSPDGGMVGYMFLVEDQQFVDDLPSRHELWVTEADAGTSPRRVASDLMYWFDFFGRRADGFAWWKDRTSILALPSDDVVWIDRKNQLRGPVNNRLVSIDVSTGDVSELVTSSGLQRQMKREAPTLENEVAISAPATTKDGERAAFLAMDYMNVYSVGMIDSSGQMERLATVPTHDERELVVMGAPVWSPDDTRIAYFRWKWRPSVKASIEVFDPSTEAITRVWESVQYPKPTHWDWSPDGKWIWVIAAVRTEERHGGVRVPQDVSMLASVTQPGHVETIRGIILDWCCAR